MHAKDDSLALADGRDVYARPVPDHIAQRRGVQAAWLAASQPLNGALKS